MLVPLSDGGYLENSWTADRYRFDFIRIHIETRHQDHVLLSVLDVDESLLIHVADVARAQPASGQHHLRGFIRTLPVAAHHLRAAHADFADLAERQILARIVLDGYLGRRDRQADRTVEIQAWRIDGGDGGRLGEAPALRQHVAGRLLPAL